MESYRCGLIRHCGDLTPPFTLTTFTSLPRCCAHVCRVQTNINRMIGRLRPRWLLIDFLVNIPNLTDLTATALLDLQLLELVWTSADVF